MQVATVALVDGPVLRVATANAASGRGAAGRPDLPAFAADAALLDVDVLAVQEVDHLLPRSGAVDQTAVLAAACAGDGPPWTARFAAAVLGTPGPARAFRPATGGDREAGEPAYGVALLSRHPVTAWSELRMRPSRVALPVPDPAGGLQWAPDEQRVALAGVVAAPGGPVGVVVTHLSFAPLRAAAQLRELRRWARDLPRPLLLLGDLNLPGGVPAALTGWAPLVRATTFPATAPRVQLDHVLLDAGGGGGGDAGGVGGGVAGDVGGGVAGTAGAVVGEPGGRYVLGGSDHLALTATLRRDDAPTRPR